MAFNAFIVWVSSIMVGRPLKSQSRSRRKTGASPQAHIAKNPHLLSPPSSRRWKSTTSHHAPGFWNLLKANDIRLSLNKRTLQEFDRKNSLENQRQTPLEERPSEGLRAQITSAELKRFARLGGPDLSNIKGVSHVHQAYSYQGAESATVPRARVRRNDIWLGRIIQCPAKDIPKCCIWVKSNYRVKSRYKINQVCNSDGSSLNICSNARVEISTGCAFPRVCCA